MRARAVLASLALTAAKTAAATGVMPVGGEVPLAGACGYGTAPTSSNPAEFTNATYGGSGEYLALQYDPCSRYTRGKYVASHGQPCSTQDGIQCVHLGTYYSKGTNYTCATPNGASSCFTPGVSDAGITSFSAGTYGWYLYDYAGKTGSY